MFSVPDRSTVRFFLAVFYIMIINLEKSARRHAITGSLQSVLFFALFTAVWFLDGEFAWSVPWYWALGISVILPLVVLLILPLEKIGDRLVRYLRPQPPSQQFENVVTEIAIALVEPVESIQTYESPIANIAMVPCTKREIVVATTGALERLSRYELQALVAAQFAGMRDKWCRLATRAEIMWWALPWLMPLCFVGFAMGRPAAAILSFLSIFFWAFMPRWIEQGRDLCADVAAVRTTLDPTALASAMRKLADHARDVSEVKFGAWYLPSNPFIVLPKRLNSTTTSNVNGRKRSWTSADEVRMELLLRADRAEAMAEGADPRKFTGREFSKRWGRLGR